MHFCVFCFVFFLGGSGGGKRAEGRQLAKNSATFLTKDTKGTTNKDFREATISTLGTVKENILKLIKNIGHCRRDIGNAKKKQMEISKLKSKKYL